MLCFSWSWHLLNTGDSSILTWAQPALVCRIKLLGRVSLKGEQGWVGWCCWKWGDVPCLCLFLSLDAQVLQRISLQSFPTSSMHNFAHLRPVCSACLLCYIFEFTLALTALCHPWVMFWCRASTRTLKGTGADLGCAEPRVHTGCKPTTSLWERACTHVLCLSYAQDALLCFCKHRHLSNACRLVTISNAFLPI